MATYKNRCVGVLLGAMCGDVLGAFPEGRHLTRGDLTSKFGAQGLRDFVAGEHLGMWWEGPRTGMYTDDTNSTLALATSLVKNQGLNPQHVAKSYGQFWLLDPERGYPDSAKLVLMAVLQNCDIRATGRFAFADGSFANGAAMRISPIGLAFRHANSTDMRLAVSQAVVSSHVHPEAVDGAVVIASAVAYLSSQQPDQFNPKLFLEHVCRASTDTNVSDRLRLLLKHHNTKNWQAIVWCLDEKIVPIEPKHFESTFSKGWFQIHTSVAVACAIWAFVDSWHNPEEAIIRAVNLGGDCDTVGCMTGAMCGALHGSDWIPSRWFENLENGEYGRDYAVRIGELLSNLDLHRPQSFDFNVDLARERQQIAELTRQTTFTMFRAQQKQTKLPDEFAC